jgi:hypothetical protein
MVAANSWIVTLTLIALGVRARPCGRSGKNASSPVCRWNHCRAGVRGAMGFGGLHFRSWIGVQGNRQDGLTAEPVFSIRLKYGGH